VARFETTFAPYVPFGSRSLSLGDSGTDVAVLQAVYDLMLQTMNPPQGPMGQPVPITGRFDAATRQAVLNIQSYFGIGTDGVVGPATFFLFGQGVGAFTTYGGPVYGSRQLEPGASGGDVTILQNRLNTFRYAKIIGHPANGVFDSATAAAVVAFKQDAVANGDDGLPDNPIAGSGFFDASWLYTFAGGREIRPGRNGFDVVFVQALLAQLGFYGGRITGYYDAATQAAVTRFQSAQGITPDGHVGPVTFYRLGLASDQAAPSPLAIAWPPVTPPGVSVCSVGLVSQTPDLHPYGSATIAINLAEGFESLNVTGNLLPPPANFGTQFGQYAFTVTDPATGGIFGRGLMVQLPGQAEPADWAGSLSVGVQTIPRGRVTVYPTPAASETGPFGPAVLAGDLSTCH
jgi:peptidoglycan hydrolase-like protein with peptidoglycan-binding domain